MRGSKRAPGATLVALALGAALIAPGLAACSHESAFRTHFDAGRFEPAARTFAEDSSLHQDPEAVYRVGLIYASPRGPLHDLVRAEHILRGWLERFTEHPARQQVSLTLDLVLSLREIHAGVERAAAVTDSLRRANGLLTDSLAARQEQLAGILAELQRVQGELTRLKEIDLQQP